MSEIKVNKITPRTNCGTTQLGDSGDTITIPSGATISNLGTSTGFGGTGVVSWDTASIKTTGFTAVTGTGYFCDTTGGEFTVTLPLSPSAGDVVGVSDYAQTFDTDNLTLGRNGSNIGGAAVDAVLKIEGTAVTLVYVDATKGWIVTDSGNQTDAPGPVYVAATGGCIVTCGDYKMHIFTGPGALCVSCGGNTSGSNTVEYLVVAGGGAGGTGPGASNGGGGAGGFRSYTDLSPASPLNGAASLPVSATPYAIVVGGGGPSVAAPGPISKGNLSSFSTISSAGGGAGRPGTSGICGSPGYGPVTAMNGGSGGGATGNCAPGVGGLGNTPSTSPVQGYDGGDGNLVGGNRAGGGGGGANEEGGCGTHPNIGGNGGDGSFIPTAFIGPTSPSYGETGPAGRYFAGGGGGTKQTGGSFGSGGLGGGGDAANPTGVAGLINTGSGGGAGENTCTGSGTGGSGIVIIRYKYQ